MTLTGGKLAAYRVMAEETVDVVAAKLGLEPIKVLEVVTFYPGFRQEAPGKYHIRVCRTLSCCLLYTSDAADE